MAEPKHVAAPLSELQRKLGISDEQVRAARQPEGEAYMPHGEFEKRHGYQEPTECAGTLLVEDKSGPVWVGVCDECGFEVGISIGRTDPESLHAHCMERARIPERFIDKEFEKHPDQERTLAVCRQWVTEYKPGKGRSLPAVALWGPAGRGKSHLLSLIAQSLIKKHLADVRFVSFAELLDELRDEMRSGVAEGYERCWRRVLEADVLVLDDVGAERRTDFANERRAMLVDRRYAMELPIVLATNVPPQRWRSEFGDRTGSRLAGMCVALNLAGPDRRAEMGRQLAITGDEPEPEVEAA